AGSSLRTAPHGPLRVVRPPSPDGPAGRADDGKLRTSCGRRTAGTATGDNDGTAYCTPVPRHCFCVPLPAVEIGRGCEVILEGLFLFEFLFVQMLLPVVPENGVQEGDMPLRLASDI